MSIWGVFSLVVQGAIVFLFSTFIFDVVHFLLHRWARSSVPLLRQFSSWHNVHHKFLDEHMNINPQWVKANFWAHLLPEFATSILGTVVFYLFFHWIAVTAVLGIHAWKFIGTLREEGIDYNHMAMDRVSGRVGLWRVDQSYHALHHIYPDNFYSSYINIFDLLFGTTCKIRKRRFLVTGAGGAFGAALVARLKEMGALVETARHGVDFSPGNYEGMREKLARTDVLVLAHGAKSEDCWNANYHTPTGLADLFIEIGRDRLVPPEIWGLGSEAELHGDMGMAELRDYAASKRAFAAKALHYYHSGDVLYRHIVPSAFTSAMGKGLMSAAFAVNYTLFFIRRGFRYVPVTLTTLAFWNYLRFRLQRRADSVTKLPSPALLRPAAGTGENKLDR